MKVSYNWLKEYIDLNLPDEEVADRLTLCGLEIEEVEKIGSKLEGVVVGDVLECAQHPNADRLKVCQVNTGNETVQIVCGAANVAAGQKVVVATVGTELPITLDNGKNLVIKKAKLRGEESRGMICAEDELGLGDDHSGIMVLDTDAAAGTPISEVVELYEDTVFEIAITPNRPDATCHIGVARDLAAVLDLDLKYPEITVDEAEIADKDLDIQILDTEKCYRYVGKIVRGVTIKESPTWLKNRLEAIGLRSINNVVDVTNYVMYELGQPLHAFDYDQVAGKKIVVQSFNKETKFTTLDDSERKIAPNTLFICDGDKPVAVAGVMGGQNSEVSDDTTNILIEAAYFEPGTVRKTSKALALQTDSSYRFERGIDPEIAPKAAQRAADLIAELGEGEIIDGSMDVHPVETYPLNLSLRTSFLNRILGTELETQEAAHILNKLGFKIKDWSSSGLNCVVPTYRPDVEREIDLVEEVGRIMDYNTIPSPEHAQYFTPDPIPFHEHFLQKVNRLAVMAGFREIYSNSLLPKERAAALAGEEVLVDTLNPVSQEMTTLRPNMLHGLLTSFAYNFNRKAAGVRFFEVGHTFLKTDTGNWVDGVQEDIYLILGIGGTKHVESWQQKETSFSAFDLKAGLSAVLNGLNISFTEQIDDTGRLSISSGKTEIAYVGTTDEKLKKDYDLSQDVYFAEVNLSRIEEILTKTDESGYTPVPKFPSFEFDLAIVVSKEVPASSITETIKSKAGSLLESISIFDVFESEALGNENKSLAYRLNFLDPNKTLNIKDIEPIISKVLKALDSAYSAKLRS